MVCCVLDAASHSCPHLVIGQYFFPCPHCLWAALPSSALLSLGISIIRTLFQRSKGDVSPARTGLLRAACETLLPRPVVVDELHDDMTDDVIQPEDSSLKPSELEPASTPPYLKRLCHLSELIVLCGPEISCAPAIPRLLTAALKGLGCDIHSADSGIMITLSLTDGSASDLAGQ